MDKNQRVVVVLLILAIIFSVASVVANIAALNLDDKTYNRINSNVVGNQQGNVELFVEGPGQIGDSNG